MRRNLLTLKHHSVQNRHSTAVRRFENLVLRAATIQLVNMHLLAAYYAFVSAAEHPST